MFAINTTKLKNRGKFKIASSDGVSDNTLLAIATEYRTSVSRRYKTLPAHALETTFHGKEKVLASIKYDGEGTFLFYDESKEAAFLFNAPSGRVRIGLDCIDEAVAKLKAAGITSFLGVCELYLEDEAGKPRPQVGDVIHVSFNGEPQELTRLRLGFYDIVMLNRKDWRGNQTKFETTWNELGQIFGENGKAHRVEGKIIPSDEVKGFFTTITNPAASGGRGREGIVIRSLSTPDVIKVKPAITVDAVVIGYVEGDFEGKYGVTSLLVGLSRANNNIQAFFRVGSGFSDEQRIQLLERLKPIQVDAPIQLTDSEGRPIQFIQPNLIVEIEGESLVEENFYGKRNTSQVFSWDPKTKTYSFIGLHPIPLLTHATFSRFREDKTFTDGGARCEQVMPDSPLETNTTKNEPAKTIFRQVFSKKDAVRKILVVTNNSPFPYTVVYIDYSPERAEPYKQEIKAVTTTSRLLQHVASYQEEGRKKGWTEVAHEGELPS
jgi:hypothetical protein